MADDDTAPDALIPEDDVDRIADAYDVGAAALRRVVDLMHHVERELEAEEERRAGPATPRAELRALRSARMALVDARKHLRPAVERAEGRLRAFEREHFEPE